MKAELFRDHRTNGKDAMRIYELCSDGTYRYLESIIPEGNCADWAEKFWDAAYVAIKNGGER